MAKATTLKLNNGLDIPVLGLGTYARGGSQNNECRLAVEAALSCGYRHIDTAAFYGNEDEVGDGIKNMINKGIVKREEVFLTTKLWNDCHELEKVVPALKDSLNKFGLDYVDLYLIHWPIGINASDGSYNDIDFVETWKGMEKCLELGLAKSIGVSNFNISQLEKLLSDCKVVPAVNQIEMNANLTQKKLLEYCKSKGIVVTAYSPFGSMPTAKTTATSPAPRLDDPILSAMGKKYNKTTTQIILRYLVDSGAVVIPKSVTPSRIQQNIDIFDFSLTPEELKQIDDFNKDFRVVAVSFWKDHKYFPF